MIARLAEITFATPKEGSWEEITEEVNSLLSEWKADVGIATIQVIGSTGSVVSIECEDGLLSHDLAGVVAKLVPTFAKGESQHEAKWDDGNAHSHLRASLFGAQTTLTVAGGRLNLGKWQHVVFLEFDIQSRERRVSLAFVGSQRT